MRKRIKAVICMLLVMAVLFSENAFAVFADTVSNNNVSGNGISLNRIVSAGSASGNSSNGLSKNTVTGNKEEKKDTKDDQQEVQKEVQKNDDKTVSPDEADEISDNSVSSNETNSDKVEEEENKVEIQAKPSVSEASISLNASLLTVSYDAAKHSFPIIELSGVAEELQDKYTVSYNYTDPETKKHVTTNDRPEFKNVGTYAISVNLISSNELVKLEGDDVIKDVYKNYEFKIEPRKVVITSDSYTREYDGTELVSHNAVIGTQADRAVLSADGIALKLGYSGSQKIVGSSDNVFFIESPEEAALTNYSFETKYGVLTVTPKKQDEVSRNSLAAPTKTKAVLGKDGKITISWKGVKSYPDAGVVTDKSMKKTKYLVYRYDKDAAAFMLLSKDPVSGEPKYVTSASYKDTSYNLNGSYLYRIDAYGIDSSGKYGAGTPAYTIANTKAFSARAYGEYEGLMFEFADVGADSYIIERSYTYNKEKFVEEFTVKGSQLTRETYQGSSAKYETATLVYKDSGPHITGAANKGIKYYYRVKAAAMQFSDGSINGQTAETPYSNKVSGKVAAESVKLLSVSTDKYNSAYLQWEASNKVSQNSEYPKDSWYAIYRSTSKASGYKKVLTIRASKINDVLASGRLSSNGASYTYHFTDLNPEINYYYQVQLVYKNSYIDTSGKLKTKTTTTAMSSPLAVKPKLDEIKDFKVAASTTGGVTVSIDAVDGAKEYMVYYVKLSDYANSISGNAPSKSEIVKAFKGKVQKNKIKGTVNTKTGYVNASITGLKHGSTYAFYANPIRGKEHITDADKKVYDTQMVKAGAPKVTAKVESFTRISFSWSKVSGATGYYITCYNEYGEVITPSGFAYAKSTRSKLKEIYNNRKITIDDVEPGVLYTCEVTPYRSDKETTTEMDEKKGIGLRGETGSASEMGRPFEPTDVKATFYTASYTSGSVSADACVTWKDNSKNSKHSGKIKYMLTRRLYSYNSKTKLYDIQVGSDTTLIDMKTGKKVYEYKDKTAHQIPYNTVAEYAVAAVYYDSKNKTIGENHDGYVRGLEAKVRYMNPTKIKFSKSSYTVATGSKVDTNITVSPTPSKTTVNSAVGYRFEVDEYDKKDKKYYLQSDSSTIAAKYVYMDSDDIHARSSTIPEKYRIYLVAFSKNDPSIKTARVRIKVSKSESSSSKSSSDSNDGGGLVIMLDAGHGGSDSGATAGGITEKALNLQYAKKVKEELEAKGAKVYMTRTDDTYVTLTDRTKKAKDKGCNLFISLHMNSGGSSGTEVYYSVNSSCAKKKLAGKLAENISDALGINNRGAKTRTGTNGDYYSVIRTSAAHGIPGLIVEHGFIDNSTDRSALQNKIDKAASEEARTIIKYWDQ